MILFVDATGTLFDDMPIWEKAMRATFSAFGKEPPTIAEYFWELESGDYLEVYRRRGITASREDLNAVYEPIYEADFPNVRLFPFAKEALNIFHTKDVRLALLTTQKEMLVTPLLQKYNIDHLFLHRAFHALDKRSVIEQVIQREKADRSFCYLMGDAPSDMRHARKAGIVPIAFLAGYIPEELVRSANPEISVSSWWDLATLL